MSKYYYSTYSHRLVIKDTLVTKYFIVIREKETENIVLWTNYDQYVLGDIRTNLIALQSNHREQISSVVMLLNYVFFQKSHIRKLTDLTIDMISSFLNDYGLKRLPDDDETTHRNEKTVEKVQNNILNFLIPLARSGKMKFKESDLYRTEESFSKKKRRIVRKKVPVFKVFYVKSADNIIFRDIPEKAFQIIFNLIVKKYKRLLMLVCLGAFAGLRPAEACNVRRADSELGAGIRFEFVDGEIVNIFIDLTKKINIRSDLKNVGGIKRYRTQKVYPIFLTAFYECYQEYMKYIEGQKYEKEYGALTNGKYGKALTYNSYYQEFRKVIEECIPIMLQSDDPEIVNYGMLLQEKRISPHIFRHWFSTKLAIYGEDASGLMYWRGDKSPESALTYIQNKSDLTKKYSSTVEKIFDYTQWKARKEYGRKNN